MIVVCLGYGWGITRVCLWYGKAKGMFWLLMLKGIFRDLYPLSKEYCIHKKDPILNQCAIVLKGLCARFNQILHPFQCRRFFKLALQGRPYPLRKKVQRTQEIVFCDMDRYGSIWIDMDATEWIIYPFLRDMLHSCERWAAACENWTT